MTYATLQPWLDHNAQRPRPEPFPHGPSISGDSIDLDSYLVLEGEAAGDSMRRHCTATERAALEAIPELLP